MELTAFTNPIERWALTFERTAYNLGNLGEMLAANPAPILQQVIDNQIGYAETIGGVVQDVADTAVRLLDPNNPFSVPGLIQQAFADLAAGDFESAVKTFYRAVNSPLVSLAFALDPIVVMLQAPFQNLANVVGALPDALTWTLSAVITPVTAVVEAFADSGQEFMDAVGSGDLVTAASVVLNAPAEFTDAFVNGYRDVQFGLETIQGGLLTTPVEGFFVGEGSMEYLLRVRDRIAEALGLGASTADAAVETTDAAEADALPADAAAADAATDDASQFAAAKASADDGAEAISSTGADDATVEPAVDSDTDTTAGGRDGSDSTPRSGSTSETRDSMQAVPGETGLGDDETGETGSGEEPSADLDGTGEEAEATPEGEAQESATESRTESGSAGNSDGTDGADRPDGSGADGSGGAGDNAA